MTNEPLDQSKQMREISRKLDVILAASLYAAAAASYRPKRKTLGDRLWDLI